MKNGKCKGRRTSDEHMKFGKVSDLSPCAPFPKREAGKAYMRVVRENNRDSPSIYFRVKTQMGRFNALIPCIPFSRPSTSSGQAPQEKGTMTIIKQLDHFELPLSRHSGEGCRAAEVG